MPKHPARATGFLSLQANIICLLLALVGSMAIIQHPTWFGGVPMVRTMVAPQSH
jgi:fumarate reductase subunit C